MSGIASSGDTASIDQPPEHQKEGVHVRVFPTSAVPDVRVRVVAEGPSLPEAVKYAPAGVEREKTVDAALLESSGAEDADSTAPTPSRSVNAPVLTSSSTEPNNEATRTAPGSGDETLKGAYADL